MRLLSAEDMQRRLQETHELVARRAFELFESGDRQAGHDLEDWVSAEAELLTPVHYELAETDSELTVRAELPGFRTRDLEVSVEPRRITIAARRGIATRQSAPQAEALQVVELPSSVDTNDVTATLRQGVLAVEMRKANGTDGRESR